MMCAPDPRSDHGSPLPLRRGPRARHLAFLRSSPHSGRFKATLGIALLLRQLCAPLAGPLSGARPRFDPAFCQSCVPRPCIRFSTANQCPPFRLLPQIKPTNQYSYPQRATYFLTPAYGQKHFWKQLVKHFIKFGQRLEQLAESRRSAQVSIPTRCDRRSCGAG
jgi:hypothetical protein